MTVLSKYTCWVASDIGHRRRSQEDAVAVPGLSEARPHSWQTTLSPDAWAFIADGMGGHAAGEVASELAVTMLSGIVAHLHTKAAINSALQQVHAEIIASAARHEAFRGMGTAIAGLLLTDGACLAFNLGDSRIYHLGGNGLRQVSLDHSSDGGLYGYLGGSRPALPRHPDYHSIACRHGEIAMLCTDGLTNMLSNLEIEAILAEHSTNPARSLVDAALEAGGHDNVSVVVIRVEEGTTA